MAANGEFVALLMDFENLIIGLENNDPTNEKPFSVTALIEHLEEKHGSVVYRKAFADWGNATFRKYAPDLQKAGVEMQHVVRTGYNSKNAADMFMVLQAMDCVLTFAHITTYVIVTGDADFLPLISRLKATGKKVVGVGTEGTIANTLIRNCDEYIYCTPNGLRSHGGMLRDKAWVVDVLRPLFDQDSTRTLESAERALKEQDPQFAPDDFGALDLEDLLGSMPRFFSLAEQDGTRLVKWEAGQTSTRFQNAEQSFEAYMAATRWYVSDPLVRDRILAHIHELLKVEGTTLIRDELREKADPGGEATDKQWSGILFSMIYGGCLYERADQGARRSGQRDVSLFRGVTDLETFRLRYYASLFHKAYSERNDLSPKNCATLLYPDDPDTHVDFFTRVLQSLALRH